jgi:PQQ-like domain
MMQSRTPALLASLIGLGLLWSAQAPGAATAGPGVDWPQFRGIRAAGVADGKPMPVTWDVDKGTGIRWKTPIPGLGHSSPVVWGEQIFLSTAISGQRDAACASGSAATSRGTSAFTA